MSLHVSMIYSRTVNNLAQFWISGESGVPVAIQKIDLIDDPAIFCRFCTLEVWEVSQVQVKHLSTQNT